MSGTFTYVPDRDFSKSTKPRVLLYQFGDGYAQRTPDGINNMVGTFNLVFTNRSNIEADAILAFLEANKGSDYFTWTPPGSSTAIKVIAQEWSEVYVTDFAKSVSTQFIQVFDK